MSKRNSERIGSNCGSTGGMICSSRYQNIRGESKVACNNLMQSGYSCSSSLQQSVVHSNTKVVLALLKSNKIAAMSLPQSR